MTVESKIDRHTAGAQDLDEAMRDLHLVPLWRSVTAHKPDAGPDPAVHWPWKRIRQIVNQALQMVSPEVVERRVLRLADFNSRAPGYEATIGNITAAIQILAPGETARPHRHSMGALRFVLEGTGVTTVVNGKQCPMETGDLILTPAWAWHEHRHHGDQPMIWLDILDVPIHHHLQTVQFQPGPAGTVPGVLDDKLFATPNIIPQIPYADRASPVFRYSYENAAAALSVTPEGQDGLSTVRFVNPFDGGSAIPFIDSRMMRIAGTQLSRPARTNAALVMAVVNGEGESCIGGQKVGWSKNDIIAVPPNNWVSHRATTASADLFVVSDRDLLERLGLLREDLQPLGHPSSPPKIAE